jgi:hypothetical protein
MPTDPNPYETPRAETTPHTPVDRWGIWLGFFLVLLWVFASMAGVAVLWSLLAKGSP